MRLTALVLAFVSLSAPAAELEIRVIYDNTSARADMTEHWGYSAVVTFRGHRVLFDSGTKPQLFMENLKKAGVDPASIESAVISHDHPDHRSGIHLLYPQNRSMTVYYLDNFIPQAFAEADAVQMKPVRVTRPLEIVPGVFTTGIVEGQPPEQALAIETSKGIVMLTGCSHPGVVKMVETVEKQRGRDRLRLLLGGFHLFQMDAEQIAPIISRLQLLRVASVIPAHCSGDLAKQMFQKTFGKDYDTAGAGKVISLD